ncbi:MAG: hypothetical protein EBR60_02200 [Burkholderiaceae bacterium]|nr:hypothetical protein [Burkholderiaceae bacterium]
MPDINLNPYTAESEAIARRLRMAEMLAQQSMQPMALPQQPGVRVSHASGLAKMLDAYTAGKETRAAKEEQKALAEKYQGDITNDFQAMIRALQAPAQAGQPAIEPTFQEGQSTITQGGQAAIPARPAGYLPAEGLSGIKTEPVRQAYMAQLLAQAAPKAPIKASAGDVFLDPVTLKPLSTIPEKPSWEKYSKFDDNGQEITGLINKNAPAPLDTFVEGARKPEDLVSVETTNDQGQPVTRYFKKSDPLLAAGVPKPLVGILGDLQVAGALPKNWKENPAIVDLVNTSLVNKAGGITPKNVFDFKVALADLNIKKATLTDQGISANVAIPTAPTPTTGVLGAIQNQPVSQPAIPTAQAAPIGAPPVVAPAVQPRGRAYTPLNAPRAPAVAPAPATAPAPAEIQDVSGLSPRDQREVAKQKLMSANKDMTEGQSNAALFGGSMAQANTTMRELEKAGTVKNAVIPAMMQSLVGLVPLGVGEKVADQIESIARTDPTSLVGPNADQQRLAQAQIAFATAWLRKTSGASFGASEVSNTIKEFFPMIGEGDKVIKQKTEARERAIDGMRLGTTKEGQAYIDKYMGGQSKAPMGGGTDPLGLRRK